MKLNKHTFLIIFLTFLSCSDNVRITREYVFCSDWNNSQNTASVSIRKIIPSETLTKIDLKDLVVDDIINNHSVDSSFCYTTGYVKKEVDKIFFSKKNEGFKWRKECCQDMDTYLESIPLLQVDSWYKFYDILPDHVYYVYVDIEGETHLFESLVYKGPW